MTRKLLLSLVVLGLSVVAAYAKSYSVTLVQPSLFGGTELKPGEYQVELQDQQVTIKSGKTKVSAPVKVETGDTRYNSTVVRYSNTDGKLAVQEIRLGGTKTKLVLEGGGMKGGA
ncbi:MAG TPA: hypothetical protein VG672_30130 [Bryobacteraceae bacterium]|nr:hypothetical protein [Bryobacteraceae bacterium]